jgi:hypothetical protein
LRATFARWSNSGASRSVIAGRFRALRSAVGWAYDERIIDHHPIHDMRGPGRAEPRRPLTDGDLRAVLWTAEANLLAAVVNDGRARADERPRLAEQDLLLVRLAAHSGGRPCSASASPSFATRRASTGRRCPVAAQQRHIPGRPRPDPAGASPTRAHRRGDDAARVRLRPPADRRHDRRSTTTSICQRPSTESNPLAIR